MGGPETLQALFGAHSAVPGDWMVLAEGAEDTREFLASIDFFVYFHASYYREAFGRSIVEAMASGAVVILQDSFEPVFGSAAVYCAPAEVASVVSRLAASQADYDAQAARGRAFVEASSSYDSYVQLIRRLRTDTSAA
jgi:glycosyltransferase involved in cell wall biosynthesis